MIEFRVAELRVNDEFTVNEGETWYRVTNVIPTTSKKSCKIEAAIINPPAGYENVKYTLTRNKSDKVIVR
jgi:hypothetical protein